jgi:hypothetical protein
MKRNRTIVRADAATRKEIGQGHPQRIAVLIPVLQGLSLRVRAVAPGKLNPLQIQFALGLPN